MTEPTVSWHSLRRSAELLDRSGALAPFEVAALRRRNPLRTIEGLWLGDAWTDVFEPVRQKVHFFGRWHQIQSIDSATLELRAFVEQRPDLA